MLDWAETLKNFLIVPKNKKSKKINDVIDSNLKAIDKLNSRIDAIQAKLNGEDNWFLKQDKGE